MANVIMGTAVAEFLAGSEENDIIYTNGGADTVLGFGGNDTLVQRGGTASLNGGLGNDVFVIFDGSINISESMGGGVDTLRTYVTMTSDLAFGVENIENIFYGAALTLLGNALDNQIICGLASDTAFGRGGNDVIVGSQVNSCVLNGEAGNDNLIGGNNVIVGDTLNGGDGNDRLEGRAGPDNLLGGAGNDTYVLTNDTTDIITETTGIDTITSTISRTLTNPLIENLTLLGSANRSGTGNAAANVLTGNSGANVLDGKQGNDILIGNTGKDTLTGGANNDTFLYLNKTHSVAGGSRDIIKDFDDLGNDRVDVSALFGTQMTYRHSLAFTASGQVRINDISGADVLVEVNTGGTLAADFSIRLAATTLASMTASDFIL
jgi:Ca2+-binding RTX toxin-like protein